MLNRWTVLYLLAGVLVGFAVAGRPVTAQTEPRPFNVGDEITVSYENDRSYTCVVGELYGSYVRCDRSRTTSIGRRPSPELWLHLRSVMAVERHRK